VEGGLAAYVRRSADNKNYDSSLETGICALYNQNPSLLQVRRNLSSWVCGTNKNAMPIQELQNQSVKFAKSKRVRNVLRMFLRR
jgi:hypothetical protein